MVIGFFLVLCNGFQGNDDSQTDKNILIYNLIATLKRKYITFE